MTQHEEHEAQAEHSTLQAQEAMAAGAPLVGKPAPGFKGQACFKGYGIKGVHEVSLEDYKDKWLVLFFFAAAFSNVCASEVKAFSEDFAKFQAEGAEVLAVSGDTHFTLSRWMESGDLGEVPFPLMSDANHHTSAAYGIHDGSAGVDYRGLFIVNPKGVVKHMVVYDLGIGRSTGETLRVLQALKRGVACEANWHKK